MPIKIDGHIYYRTSEVCEKTGISRATLYRWFKNDTLEKPYRDRRGWRLFTEDDIARIIAESAKITWEGQILEEARTKERY